MKIILFIPFLLLFSCDDNYRYLPQLEVIDFIMDECHSSDIEGRFVVTSDSSYQAVMANFKDGSDTTCHTTLPNPIDFNTYSLLGYKACGSGCEVSFNRKVYQDDENQKYIYDVEVETRGGCEPWICSMNWILIPKMEEDYFVDFL